MNEVLKNQGCDIRRLFLPTSAIQSIVRFVTPRFVNKTRFVNIFFGNENVTNRVRGGFHKTKCKILISIFVV